MLVDQLWTQIRSDELERGLWADCNIYKLFPGRPLPDTIWAAGPSWGSSRTCSRRRRPWPWWRRRWWWRPWRRGWVSPSGDLLRPRHWAQVTLDTCPHPALVTTCHVSRGRATSHCAPQAASTRPHCIQLTFGQTHFIFAVGSLGSTPHRWRHLTHPCHWNWNSSS